ncbi:hypothetical protein AB0D49_28995 [Streptomyces sp. NPDC048290]
MLFPLVLGLVTFGAGGPERTPLRAACQGRGEDSGVHRTAR